MNRSALFAFVAIVVAGSASASTSLSPIQVQSALNPARGTFLACEDTTISQPQLQRLLGRHEPSESRVLRRQLTAAVHEACGQRVPRIVVDRNGATVEWAPAPADGAVARR